MNNTCVCCGEIIPEGRQVCPACIKQRELKPCPFCGCGDVRKMTDLRHTAIWCGNCGATITRSILVGKHDCLEDAEADFGVEAIAAWNRRADNEHREAD